MSQAGSMRTITFKVQYFGYEERGEKGEVKVMFVFCETKFQKKRKFLRQT